MNIPNELHGLLVKEFPRLNLSTSEVIFRDIEPSFTPEQLLRAAQIGFNYGCSVETHRIRSRILEDVLYKENTKTITLRQEQPPPFRLSIWFKTFFS